MSEQFLRNIHRLSTLQLQIVGVLIILTFYFCIQSVTGKEIIFGFDKKGRPALYMIPSRQNTNVQLQQLQYAVWMLERCIDLMGPGVEWA